MITMDKKYKTANGQPARILCTDAPGHLPVVAVLQTGTVLQYDEDGWMPIGLGSPYNLIEVGQYDDFKIDEPVMVRSHGKWTKRHFAGVRDGLPVSWDHGQTKWSSDGSIPTSWLECRRPTAEELAK